MKFFSGWVEEMLKIFAINYWTHVHNGSYLNVSWLDPSWLWWNNEIIEKNANKSDDLKVSDFCVCHVFS